MKERKRAVIYGRYSSDLQRDASLDDQIRDCRTFCERNGWEVVQVYADAAVSGAIEKRAQFQTLLRAAQDGLFDVVVSESVDRLSRDPEHLAHFYKRMSFAGISIVTIQENEVGHLQIGLKGTMAALFLEDLAVKTRRGLRGRVEAGKSGGGNCFGYRPVNSTGERGERVIVPEEAVVVVRVFEDYRSGRSPKAICKALNGERVPAPAGGTWTPSAIHGHERRGTGILNNELYIGILVWNRQRYLKNPLTGRRVSRINPTDEQVRAEVPHLRIVTQELWDAVKIRQQQMRHQVKQTSRLNAACRPKHIFSGLTKCGQCGASFVMYGRRVMTCSARKDRGTCTNRLTIRREEIERRALTALQTRFFQKEHFAVFCREFTAALNESRMEHRANTSAARRELQDLENRKKRLVDAISAGVPGEELRDAFAAITSRRQELEQLLKGADNTIPLLHPSMAQEFCRAVTELRDALTEEQCEPGALRAVRELVEEIRLTPRDGVLAIDVKGNLAAMFAAANPAEDWQRQFKMVAGAGFEPATFGL